MQYWGYHLMVNAGRCRPHTIRSYPIIEHFSNTLVKRIDMVPYGKPQIVMFGSGNKRGYTLVQLIETSNICAHFVEETNDVYLDVFSCKTFDPKIVESLIRESFRAEEMDSKFILRDARARME